MNESTKVGGQTVVVYCISILSLIHTSESQ